MALGMGMGLAWGIHYLIRHLQSGWLDMIQDTDAPLRSEKPQDDSEVKTNADFKR